MGLLQNLTLFYQEESPPECRRPRSLLPGVGYVRHGFLACRCCVLMAFPGDMEVLFDRHKGWGYKADIGEKYGGVVRLHGMFGVSMHLLMPVDTNVFLVRRALRL